MPRRSSWSMCSSTMQSRANSCCMNSSSCPTICICCSTPAKDISLERALQLIKGGFSYRLGKKHGPGWQVRFSNHKVRGGGDYFSHGGDIPVDYQRAAKVRKGGICTLSVFAR